MTGVAGILWITLLVTVPAVPSPIGKFLIISAGLTLSIWYLCKLLPKLNRLRKSGKL